MTEALRYRTYHPLGSGGMGEVHLGALVGADGIHRRVAIKRLSWPLSRDAEAVERFLGEAALLSRLTHPNIVSIIDYQTDETGPFLVMDYVDGCTLSKLLSKGACPPSTAVHIATEMLRALAYVHAMPIETGMRGLVHRDISPQNVLLSWEGTVVVSDFGVAKVMETLGAVRSRSFRGKVAYASPEQVKRQTLDGRSDLFSVGVVLWEMLSGRALFHDATSLLTSTKVLFDPIPPPGEARPISTELQAVVGRLLERKVDRRYRAAEEVLEGLLRCPEWPRSGRDELAHLLASRFERLRRSPVTVVDPFRRGPGADGHDESTASATHDLAPQAGAGTFDPEEPSAGETRSAVLAAPRRAGYSVAFIALAIALVTSPPSDEAVEPSASAPFLPAPAPAAPHAPVVPHAPAAPAPAASKAPTSSRESERSPRKVKESTKAATARRPSSRGGATVPAAPGETAAAARGDSAADESDEANEVDAASVYPKDVRAKLSTAGSSATK